MKNCLFWPSEGALPGPITGRIKFGWAICISWGNVHAYRCCIDNISTIMSTFPQKGDFWRFFGLFSIYLAPSGAKYCGKGLAAIGKSFGKGSGWVWKAANFEMLVSGAPGARNQHLGRTDGGLNFQAVIKSAASAASLGTQKKSQKKTKNREKMKEQLPFLIFYIGQTCAKHAQKHAKTTKIRVWSKSQKSQNGFVDHPSPVFVTANPFRDIWPR